MYVCQECKSTEFEKIDGFLYCLVCQVQQKDYVEYVAEVDPRAETRTMGSQKKASHKGKLLAGKQLSDALAPWDAYNHILLGFMKEFTDTGLAPRDLQSIVLSIWMAYVTISQRKTKTKKKRILKKSTRKRSIWRRSTQKAYLGEDSEVLHMGKRKKNDGEQKFDDDELIFTPMSQASTCSVKQLERKMIERHYKDFLRSEESKIGDAFANETIETIGRQPVDDPDMPSTSQASHLRYGVALDENDKPSTRIQVKKLIPMCKGRALEMIHIGLLLCGSAVQLSDLLRFIREGHIAYAKITHFLPQDVKLTRENYGYLETVNDRAMPRHAQQRRLGAKVAKILGIEELPVPDLSRLIKRYVTDLRLPVMVASYAVVLSEIADVENLCSFKREKKRIPNYEAMAAASIILTLKFLFGLDDQTELLLSDMANKTNELLKEEGNSDSVELFTFDEWKKSIELRKTILSEVHYPTQEKLGRHSTSAGFLDMLLKESKDLYRQERFETYNQYYMKPEITDACKELLESLIEPNDEITMNFPPSLKPQTKYLEEILADYDRREKEKAAGSSPPGCIIKITEWARTFLAKTFDSSHVFYMHKPKKYEELLYKNGYKIRTLSKRDQIMPGFNRTDKISDDDPEEGQTVGSHLEQDVEMTSLNETDGEKMDIPDAEELEMRNWRGLLPIDGGKEFMYYVGKPLTRWRRKIKTFPEPKFKGTTWSDIDYYNLGASRTVYFVKDMALIWKLESPCLSEDCDRFFMFKVFKKTPNNFQWIVRQFASMLEMKVRDVYAECYKLEVALEKAKELPHKMIEERIQ